MIAGLTSEQWLWISILTALMVGAAGGFAFMFVHVRESIRFRRNPDDTERYLADFIADFLMGWDAVEQAEQVNPQITDAITQADETIRRQYRYPTHLMGGKTEEQAAAERELLPGNDGRWFTEGLLGIPPDPPDTFWDYSMTTGGPNGR